MLKIIERKNTDLPITCKLSKGFYFQPGMIAGFIREEKEIVAGISNGVNNVIGIIDDFKDGMCDSTVASGRMMVWNCADMVVATDQFDRNAKVPYSEDIPLYCNEHSMFTSDRNGGSLQKEIATCKGLVIIGNSAQLKLKWH